MNTTRKKPKQPRNWHAVNAIQRTSAGPHGKKGRKKDKEYGRLRSAIEDAVLKEVEDDE